jgi:hypothetical protein
MSTDTVRVVARYGHQRPLRRVMLCGPAGITVLTLVAGLMSSLARPAPGHDTAPGVRQSAVVLNGFLGGSERLLPPTYHIQVDAEIAQRPPQHSRHP